MPGPKIYRRHSTNKQFTLSSVLENSSPPLIAKLLLKHQRSDLSRAQIEEITKILDANNAETLLREVNVDVLVIEGFKLKTPLSRRFTTWYLRP